MNGMRENEWRRNGKSGKKKFSASFPIMSTAKSSKSRKRKESSAKANRNKLNTEKSIEKLERSITTSYTIMSLNLY